MNNADVITSKLYNGTTERYLHSMQGLLRVYFQTG